MSSPLLIYSTSRFISIFPLCLKTKSLTWTLSGKSIESSNYCTNYHLMIMKSGKKNQLRHYSTNTLGPNLVQNVIYYVPKKTSWNWIILVFHEVFFVTSTYIHILKKLVNFDVIRLRTNLPAFLMVPLWLNWWLIR